MTGTHKRDTGGKVNMSRIAHACRRDGRYVFRRRVHFQNLISKPVTIALRTADPKLARQRAAFLSARFVDRRPDALDGLLYFFIPLWPSLAALTGFAVGRFIYRFANRKGPR